MNVILFLGGFAGLFWFLAKRGSLSVVVASLLVVLVGTTFGHEFFNLDFGPIPLTLDRVLWACLVLAMGVLWKTGRLEFQPLNLTDVAVLVLTGLLISSTLLHDWQYKDNLPMSRLLFFNLLPIGLYFIARQCPLRPSHLTAYFGVLAAFGVYLAFTAIAEQRGWYAVVYPAYITSPEHWEFLGRARGPFLNPVSCGVFLVTGMLGIAFCGNRQHPLGRLAFLLAGLLVVAACFLTLTRSVWLGCAVAVAALAWLPAQPRMRGGLVVAGTVALAFVAVAFSDKLNNFQRDKNVTVAEMSQSAQLRPMLAWVAVKMVRDKPLLGHGFGQYTAAQETVSLPRHRPNAAVPGAVLHAAQRVSVLRHGNRTGRHGVVAGAARSAHVQVVATLEINRFASPRAAVWPDGTGDRRQLCDQRDVSRRVHHPAHRLVVLSDAGNHSEPARSTSTRRQGGCRNHAGSRPTSHGGLACQGVERRHSFAGRRRSLRESTASTGGSNTVMPAYQSCHWEYMQM